MSLIIFLAKHLSETKPLADILAVYPSWEAVSRTKREIKDFFKNVNRDQAAESILLLIEKMVVNYFLLFDEVLRLKKYHDVIAVFEHAGNYFGNFEEKIDFDDEEITTFYEYFMEELKSYPDFANGLCAMLATHRADQSLFKKYFHQSNELFSKMHPDFSALWQKKESLYLGKIQNKLDQYLDSYEGGFAEISKIYGGDFYIPKLKPLAETEYYSPQEMIQLGIEKKLELGGLKEKQLRLWAQKESLTSAELQRLPKIQKGVEIGFGSKFLGKVFIHGENINLGEKNIFENVTVLGNDILIESRNVLKEVGLLIDHLSLGSHNYFARALFHSAQKYENQKIIMGSNNQIYLTAFSIDNAVGLFVGDHNQIGNKNSKTTIQALEQEIVIGRQNQLGAQTGIDLNVFYDDRRIRPEDFNRGDLNQKIFDLFVEKKYLKPDGLFDKRVFKGVTHAEFFDDFEGLFPVKFVQSLFDSLHALFRQEVLAGPIVIGQHVHLEGKALIAGYSSLGIPEEFLTESIKILH
jgi:acetyltransferase-like isoleucine patch superfamily enzyme